MREFRFEPSSETDNPSDISWRSVVQLLDIEQIRANLFLALVSCDSDVRVKSSRVLLVTKFFA